MNAPRIGLWQSLNASALSVMPLFALLAGAQAKAAEFIPLGDLPGGDFQSGAFAVSDDGRTVFGRGQIGADYDQQRLFRWVDGTMEQLSESHLLVEDVSADGSLAVGLYDEGWQWTEATGLAPLVTSKRKIIATAPQGVSSDGSVVVGSTGSGSSRDANAFRWTKETGLAILPMFPTHSSESASDVSGDGSVIVGQGIIRRGNSTTPRIPTYWVGDSDPTVYEIAPPVGFAWSIGLAAAVSPDGQVIVGWDSFGGETTGFRWDRLSGAMTITGRESLSLDAPQLTVPRDVSAGGEFVVGFESLAEGRDARIWDAVHGARDLQDVLVTDHGLSVDLAGWQLNVAAKISPDGLNIVGYGVNPMGNQEAFLVRLGGSMALAVPEPAAIALLLSGLTILEAQRKQRRPGSARTALTATPQGWK